MDIGLEEIITAIIATVVARLLLLQIPEHVTDIQIVQILNDPTVQFVLLAVVAFYVLSRILTWIRRKLRGTRTPFFEVVSPRREPTRVDDRFEVEKFGVKWPVIYGRRTVTADRYTYAENPRCPECATELMEDENKRRIRSNEQLWRCPGCGFTQERPRTWIYKENKAVEKDIEAQLRN
jgi:ribosomal protein L37AE/L43A